MLKKVRALYDFKGESDTAELSISIGEILTVTRVDVGEGWWEGSNTKGETGLFPASYVETIASTLPELPPEPPTNRYDQTADEWGESYAPPPSYSKTDGEGWDDDWDDDTYSEIDPNQAQKVGNFKNQPMSSYNEAPNYPLPGMPLNDVNNEDAASTFGGQAGTVARKNINRFSTFSKSGGESYIMGTLNITISDDDKVYIQQIEDRYIWAPILNPYTVVVASPKKESKFKGIKSFMAYQLTPSFNNIQVSRRYKHFDWLHERLTEKFCLIPIPPLPDKQISGRYEEQFVEHRRVQLQEFVDWVCRHPVLSRCEVWQHFLTCTDEKRWKAGKRHAEKDLLVGANYCISIFPPEKALLPSQIDYQIDVCNNFTHAMDSAVKILMATCVDQQKKHQGPYKREYQKIGEAFYGFGNALGTDEPSLSPSKLTKAITMTGGAYIDIGKMFEDQPKLDWEPMSDKLHIYKGIFSSYPDVLAVQKGAIQKKKECEKMKSDNKMEMAQLNEVFRRTDVITYALLAEINHFRIERNTDLKVAMQHFLRQQITFYKKVVDKLETTLHFFDEA